MPVSLCHLKKPLPLALCFVALIAMAGLAIGYQHWFTVTKAMTRPGQQQQLEAQVTPDRLVVQELLTLRRTGFDPPALTIPTGNFLLAVDNLSGFAKAQLTLVEERKDKLKDIKFESRNRDWREEIDLKPGVYILSELSHPEWLCRITVTDKVRGK